MSSTKTADALALMTAIALAAAPFAMRFPLANVIYPVGGVALVVGTERGKRNESKQSESLVDWWMSGAESVATGLFRQGKVGVRKLSVRYEVPVLPEVLKKVENDSAIEQAFNDIHKRSFLAIANTGGGKTYFLHQSAAWAIEQNEHIVICDRSYGKRGQHWHGLPVADRDANTPGIVFQGSPEDLEACVEMFFHERECRAAQTKAAARDGKDVPNFRHWALYLPERTESLIEYREKYGDEEADVLSKKLNSLLRDGHGYNVFLRSDAQSAATGEVEVSEGMRKNLHWVFFGDAVETKELGKVGIGKEWVGKVEKARTTHSKYLGLALIEGKPQFIKAPNTQYDLSDCLTVDQAAEVWLSEEGPTILGVMKFCEDDGKPTSPTSMFDSCKGMFPSGHRNKGKDNPYWQVFKSFIESQEIS